MKSLRMFQSCVVALLLLAAASAAQTGSIKGKVIDAKTKEALPSATVLLVDADKANLPSRAQSRSTVGRVANKLGQFEFRRHGTAVVQRKGERQVTGFAFENRQRHTRALCRAGKHEQRVGRRNLVGQRTRQLHHAADLAAGL